MCFVLMFLRQTVCACVAGGYISWEGRLRTAYILYQAAVRTPVPDYPHPESRAEPLSHCPLSHNLLVFFSSTHSLWFFFLTVLWPHTHPRTSVRLLHEVESRMFFFFHLHSAPWRRRFEKCDFESEEVNRQGKTPMPVVSHVCA